MSAVQNREGMGRQRKAHVLGAHAGLLQITLSDSMALPALHLHLQLCQEHGCGNQAELVGQALLA